MSSLFSPVLSNKSQQKVDVVQIDFWACFRIRCDSETPHPGHRYFQIIINDWLTRNKLSVMQIGATVTGNHPGHQPFLI